jgi:hypothetical protein
MKTFLAAVGLLCLLLTNPCFALVSIEEVTKDRAKALGAVVRSKPVGNSIYVWLEFKAAGELKQFAHAQLSIESGERFLTATLQPDRKAEGTVEVFFAADPTTLDGSTITLVVRHGERDGTGYRFKIKDFVEKP